MKNKLITLGLVLGLGLISCDKENIDELTIEQEIAQIEQEIETQNQESNEVKKTLSQITMKIDGVTASTSGKTTSVPGTINGVTIDGTRFDMEKIDEANGFPIFGAQLFDNHVDGETGQTVPHIFGYITIQMETFNTPDEHGIYNYVNISQTFNDDDGNSDTIHYRLNGDNGEILGDDPNQPNFGQPTGNFLDITID